MTEHTTITPRFNRRRLLQILAVAGLTGGLSGLGYMGLAHRHQIVRQSRILMATEINLILCGPDRDACLQAAQATFNRIEALAGIFSRHDPHSEVGRLNREGSLPRLSPELAEVMDLALSISRRTDGAFDPTVLPLLHLYGRDRLPDAKTLESTLHLVDYRKVVRRGQGVAFALPGMALTLDGIAKGYIVDQGLATLASLGFADAYVEAGGDLMVSGNKPAAQPWRIGIRQPRPDSLGAMTVISTSTPLAVATSGDYMQAFTPDLSLHHILDPRLGISPPELASATVTAPTAALADSLATAAMVLGKHRSLEMLSTFAGCEGLLIDKELRTCRSPGFQG